MGLPAKAVRAQLNICKPMMGKLSLETLRKGQDVVGKLMAFRHRRDVVIKHHSFETFTGAWVLPRDKRRRGVMLYLHGGGFTCGDLEYATGFGATLAHRCGTRVFCPAYRLAPEHPFPAAVEDALTAYRYLLKKRYEPAQISLCGESAGGGLCYSLCLRLKALGLPLPGAIIAISPWVDLTLSGDTYIQNAEADPSMTAEQLRFFADAYTARKADPLASPLFADLTGLPPSLIFVGGDEIMLSDARQLHEKLLSLGCASSLTVAPERWHGYVLYDLEENREDLDNINRFLNHHTGPEKKLRWMRLDNAAKIYPASRSRTWSNLFRLSATLTEPVDTDVLRSALDITVRRFPSIAARLRRGVFWYYLEQLPKAPRLRGEGSYPLVHMTRQEARQCAFRVIVYENRIAVEFFHSLTDGTGGLIFLKTLLAEYLLQKYGVHVPTGSGILGRLEEPSPEELEDSFQSHAGAVSASRRDTNAWRLSGTPEPDGYRNVVCMQLPVAQALEAAHRHGVTLTAFLCAAMMQALLELQKEKVPLQQLRKPIKVLLPVNLRRLFPSKSLRNFALYTTPQVNPRLGDYSFEELCRLVHHHMGMEVTAKKMGAMIATNVGDERSLLVKVMPLFIKNFAMKLVFNAVGEKKSCLSLSNLGDAKLPGEMAAYVQRMDFILGTQATAPHNCGVISCNGTLYINFIRSIQESELEAHFFRALQQQGLTALVESNGR